MPILDHVSKAVGANVTQLTVPFVFAPEAINRGLLIVAMACHPTVTGYPNFAASYDGVAADLMNLGQALPDPGVPIPRCASFFIPFSFFGNAPEPPLSGNVVVTLDRIQNLVVYAVGVRGEEYPYIEDKLGINNAAPGPPTISNLTPNDYLAFAAFAMTQPVAIVGVSDPAVSVLAEDSTGAMLGDIGAALLMLPPPTTGVTAFTAGNPNWGGIGFSCFADLPVGEPVPRALRPIGEYVKHEMFFRSGLKL